MPSVSTEARLLASIASLVVAGCVDTYPRVTVVSDMPEHVTIREIGFSGCYWPVTLGRGDRTPPGQCVPGEDRVHFQKLDGLAYCQTQIEDGVVPSCPRDDPEEQDPGLVNTEPTWFNYMTRESYTVDYWDTLVVTIRPGGIEQDFTVPGPYGH